MTDTNPVLKSIKESTGIRLALLFGMMFIGLMIASILNGAVESISSGSLRDHALLNSILQSILVFCLPAYLLGKFCSGNALKWLELTKVPEIRSLLGVVLIYIVSLPAMEWIIELNSNFHLPASLSGVENTLREWEEANANVSNMLLSTTGIWQVIAGVLIIGVLTAFSEEIFFRSSLQGTFQKGGLKAGNSIWISAFIFSTMHFQFFGFIPRLIMGAFFGYLLWWTKSVWVPIFAHALNNSLVVIISAVSGKNATSIIEASGTSLYLNHMAAVLISVVLTAMILWYGKDFLFKIKQDKKGWQKKELQQISEK